MKTKFKDFLLYSLACVGAVSLFLSATQPQQTTSTVPESHVWELGFAESSSGSAITYAINKKTGEVRKYNNYNLALDKNLLVGASTSSFIVMTQREAKK